MLRSRLFLKLFLAYSVLLSALLVASVLLREALLQSQSTWLHSPWILAALISFIAIVVSYLITQQVTAPLVRLAGVARSLTKVKESPRGMPRDEVRTLAQVIDQLHGELRQQLVKHDEQRDMSRAVLRCMVESVIVLDAEERVQFVNDAVCRLMKWDAGKVVGRKLWEVIRHRGLVEAAEAAMHSDTPVAAELELEVPVRRHLKVQGTRLVGSQHRGAVLVLHDLTDVRRLERMRQDFFTNVSHELKTPLAAIHATVETLLDGALHDPKHNVNFLRRIDENVERLSRLVTDLLELSRIETGQQQIDLAPIALLPALEACVQRLEHRALARRQILQIAADAEPIGALADELALDQILDNLVDNAIKYTPEGGSITLKTSRQDAQVRIDVIDNGVGISERDLPRIFERFFRADRSRDRQDPGTGLGLSIVKHLVQAQGGGIAVVSSLGQGSTFSVTLPMSLEPSKSQVAAA
jgi:two-component system, OmpR family, phosphate regulon sensor histidine kinase PhoR